MPPHPSPSTYTASPTCFCPTPACLRSAVAAPRPPKQVRVDDEAARLAAGSVVGARVAVLWSQDQQYYRVRRRGLRVEGRGSQLSGSQGSRRARRECLACSPARVLVERTCVMTPCTACGLTCTCVAPPHLLPRPPVRPPAARASWSNLTATTSAPRFCTTTARRSGSRSAARPSSGSRRAGGAPGCGPGCRVVCGLGGAAALCCAMRGLGGHLGRASLCAKPAAGLAGAARAGSRPAAAALPSCRSLPSWVPGSLPAAGPRRLQERGVLWRDEGGAGGAGRAVRGR